MTTIGFVNGRKLGIVRLGYRTRSGQRTAVALAEAAATGNLLTSECLDHDRLARKS
jgi:hypothetical protein